MSDTTGKTKDAGWEVGVRTTVAAPIDEVWAFLLGEGLPLWLGDIRELPAAKGEPYETKDGVRGTVRSRTDGSKLRISWQPDDWPHDSIVQVTVKESPTGTTIGLHHDHLASREERKLMLGHWKNVSAAFDQKWPTFRIAAPN